MKIGKVRKWISERGFGFVSDDAAGHDVFCHVSALPPGVTKLDVGQCVGFEIALNARSGKPQAANVRLQ